MEMISEMNGLPTDLNRHNPLPLYQQLSNILEEKIADGILKPNTPLPSEKQLIDTFGVSRHVVRQALNNLARKGLIYTEHGRGSFVSCPKIERPIDVVESYHKGMHAVGLSVDVKVIKQEIVQPPEEVVEHLGLEDGEATLYLERVAYLDDVPITILVAYIRVNPYGAENLLQFSGGSLHAFLKQAFDIEFVRARKYVEVIFSDDFESQLLSVSRGAPLLQVISISFDTRDRPVEYSKLINPGARFRLWFDGYIHPQNTQ